MSRRGAVTPPTIREQLDLAFRYTDAEQELRPVAAESAVASRATLGVEIAFDLGLSPVADHLSPGSARLLVGHVTIGGGDSGAARFLGVFATRRGH